MTATPPISLDPISEEILVDIFRQNKNGIGLVDAVSYRAEHEDWIENLNDLERQLFLKRDSDGYRITFVVLTLLKEKDATDECDRCKRVFDILRNHYKSPVTRHQEKLLKDLSEDLGLHYAQTALTIQYLMDASSLWLGGSAGNFNDPATDYVKPSESIITCKTFDDLVAKVWDWFKPKPLPSKSSLEFLESYSSHDNSTLQKIQSDLHPGPVVTSFLYSIKSEAIIRIVGRLGIGMDWTLTKEQAFSEKTRLREYAPRIERALQSLNESDRMLVAKNLTNELLNEAPEIEKKLTVALGRIGWQITDNSLTTTDLNIREAFFPSGAEHSAYVQIREILGRGKRSIDIVDPYLDGSIFIMLKALSGQGRSVRLLTTSPPSDFKLEASKFQKEFPEITLEIRMNRDFHDRFIFLDGAICFHVGASIKDAGKKAFMISQLEDGAIVDSLIAFTTSRWNTATKL